MSAPDQEKIDKLPAWVRNHIEELELQRDVAVRTVKEFEDAQTKSPFFYEEHIWTPKQSGPEPVRRYVQTNRMVAVHGGVELSVLIRDDHLELTWGEAGTFHGGEIAMIPESYMQARLVHPSCLRFRHKKV
jgi:hypothetical protein